MRVLLLDEMLDRRLGRLIPEGTKAATVCERGWNGKKNGELLGSAAREFVAFPTTGASLTSEISRASTWWPSCSGAKSNSSEDLGPLAEQVPALISGAHPGEIFGVED